MCLRVRRNCYLFLFARAAELRYGMRRNTAQEPRARHLSYAYSTRPHLRARAGRLLARKRSKRSSGGITPSFLVLNQSDCHGPRAKGKASMGRRRRGRSVASSLPIPIVVVVLAYFMTGVLSLCSNSCSRRGDCNPFGR